MNTMFAHGVEDQLWSTEADTAIVRLCHLEAWMSTSKVLRMSRRAAARQVGLRSDVLRITTAYLQVNPVSYELSIPFPANMSFSKAEYHKEELIADMPPVPEGEFCVFGIVSCARHHEPVQGSCLLSLGVCLSGTRRCS